MTITSLFGLNLILEKIANRSIYELEYLISSREIEIDNINLEENNSSLKDEKTIDNQNTVNFLDLDYIKWSNKLKETIPDIEISKSEGAYFAVLDGKKYAVVYDSPGQIRLVNATSNIFVDY